MSRRMVLALLTGSSVVQAASNAVGALAATLLLGPGERGAMVLGVTIGSIAVIVGGLGTGSALRSRLPSATVSTRDGLVASYTWFSVVATVLGAAGAGVVSVLSAPLVDPMLAQPSFVLGVVAYTAATLLLAQETDAWFAAGHFRAGGLWAAAGAGAGLLGLLAAGALGGHASSMLGAQAVGTSLVVGVAASRLRVARLWSLARPKAREVAALVRLGVPVLGATVGFILAMRADRFIIGSVAGVAAVAVYSLAATLSEFPRMLPSAVGQLLLRDVAVGVSRETVRRAGRTAVALTGAAGLAVAFGGIVLIVPVFGPEFADAPAVLVLLLVAEVCLAPYALALRGLVGGGWTTAAGLIGAVGGIGGVALFGVLVPIGGLAGAAVACVLLYLGLSASSWWLLGRRLAAVPRPTTAVKTTAVRTTVAPDVEPIATRTG